VKDFAPRGNPDFSEVGIGETSFSMPQGVPGIKLRGTKAISRKISFMQSRQNLLGDRYEFFAIRFHHTLLRPTAQQSDRRAIDFLQHCRNAIRTALAPDIHRISSRKKYDPAKLS